MVVKTYRDGLGRTGLLIGEANARRYFSKLAPSIELRLDDLHIQCTLPSEFWQSSPQIHDPRLSEWLEFKVARKAGGRDPIQLTMVRAAAPSGIETFILRPVSETQIDAFGIEVNAPHRPPGKTAFPHISAESLEQRSVA